MSSYSCDVPRSPQSKTETHTTRQSEFVRRTLDSIDKIVMLTNERNHDTKNWNTNETNLPGMNAGFVDGFNDRP